MEVLTPISRSPLMATLGHTGRKSTSLKVWIVWPPQMMAKVCLLLVVQLFTISPEAGFKETQVFVKSATYARYSRCSVT